MSEASGRLHALDRGLYALFSRHADGGRHDRDRRRYRGANLGVSFEVYVARVHGCAAALSVVAFGLVVAAGLGLPEGTVAALAGLGGRLVPVPAGWTPAVPRPHAATAAGLVAAAVARRATVAAGGQYLAWRARARRADIERTLPSAVRYLGTLAVGSDDPREMLGKVAANEDAYGETAVAFRSVCNRAALTGSLNEALGLVARDTPSRDVLAPFLLKFREHAEQGPEELATYLEMESRTLGRRRALVRERAGDYLELVAELFVVLLVLPALLVIVVAVTSVLAPGLTTPVATPLGNTTPRTLVFYASAGFVLVVGALAAVVVETLRPRGLSAAHYDRPADLGGLVVTTAANPASAAVTLAPVGVGVGAALHLAGSRPAVAVLLGYAAYGLLVGMVGVRRARRDDAKDREITDFVHAVAGHVSLGRPFPAAVEAVAGEVDLGPLDDDVADLALAANLAAPPGADADRRTAALESFVESVGTPLAEQTMGLVTGALAVGSDADEVFETLQAEIGRLHHEKQVLRNNMQVYVAVGWTTALLVAGIVVAVDHYVLSGFAQLGAVGTAGSVAIDPGAVDPAADRRRFYLVTQATMLACGWFAGTASRGRYEALLHSGALVLVAHAIVTGAGML